jgi:hypothetical protein
MLLWFPQTLLKTPPFYRSLEQTDPDHEFLKSVEEKNDLFDKAAAKFSAKVAS